MLSGIMTAHDISAQSETAGRHNDYHLSMSIVPRADEQICSFLIQRFVWLQKSDKMVFTVKVGDSKH